MNEVPPVDAAPKRLGLRLAPALAVLVVSCRLRLVLALLLVVT